MQLIENSEQFEELILAGNVFIQFSAGWCRPCKVLTKTMEEVTPEHPDVYFYKVDIDSMDRSLLNDYNVRSVPKIVMFVDGHEVADMIGSKPKEEVRNFISEHKKS